MHYVVSYCAEPITNTQCLWAIQVLHLLHFFPRNLKHSHPPHLRYITLAWPLMCTNYYISLANAVESLFVLILIHSPALHFIYEMICRFCPHVSRECECHRLILVALEISLIFHQVFLARSALVSPILYLISSFLMDDCCKFLKELTSSNCSPFNRIVDFHLPSAGHHDIALCPVLIPMA